MRAHPIDPELLTISQPDLASLLAEVGASGGSLRFRAGGRSMWPFLRGGDVLVVEPLRDRPVARGDVLLYRTSDGGVAAHRVTGFAGGRLQVRGDRLRAPLELVGSDDLLGRVAFIERRGRRYPLARRRALALAWVAVRDVLRACRRTLRGREAGARRDGAPSDPA